MTDTFWLFKFAAIKFSRIYLWSLDHNLQTFKYGLIANLVFMIGTIYTDSLLQRYCLINLTFVTPVGMTYKNVYISVLCKYYVVYR